MRPLIISALVCGFLALHPPAVSAAAPRHETKDRHDKRMAWFREARFGMFIHWGLYAIPAGEWKGKPVAGAAEWLMNSARVPVSDYQPLRERFNPVKFDADSWARLARRAGMKYVVITSKHHDGFCLWPTDQTDFNVANTPYGKDILAQLSAACRKEGLKFATYFSIMDWTHPDYLPRRPWDPRPGVPANFDRFRQVLKSELTEIITNYDPAILWFDGEWEETWTTEMGTDLYRHVRDLKPDIITNNRLGKARYLGGASAGKDSVGDYGTPEQEIPAGGLPGADWESCMTMNDTWGYSRFDHNWKSSTTLIRNLVNCASKGGNYLLNVGPTAEGYIPAESIIRLNEVGRWMDINGDSIYGTSASPFPKPLPWGAVTRKPGKLYLHVWSPEGQSVVLPGLKNKMGRAFLLSDPSREFKVTRIAEGARLSLPEALPDKSDTVIVLEIEGQAKVAPQPPISSNADGSFVLNALDARADSPARYEEDKRAIGYWTDSRATVSWTVEFKTKGAYTVTVEQAVHPDTEGAEYSVEVDGASLTGKTRATDHWNDFRTVDLGTIRIARAGRHIVSVRPTLMPGFAVMNLRTVRLIPEQ